MNGKIENVEKKTGAKGTAYYVVTINGKKSTTFDATVLNCIGKDVDATVEQNGNYWNLKSFIIVGNTTSNEPVRESKNRAFAASYAKDLMVAIIPTRPSPDIDEVKKDTKNLYNFFLSLLESDEVF